MENHVTLVVICAVVFNAVLVGGVMWLVRKTKLDQQKRQVRMIEQAKINLELRQLNDAKDRVLESYREIIERI